MWPPWSARGAPSLFWCLFSPPSLLLESEGQPPQPPFARRRSRLAQPHPSTHQAGNNRHTHQSLTKTLPKTHPNPPPKTHLLKPPRRVIILVKAGAPVDQTIAGLLQHMEPGDIIIDGGNEWYENTERRVEETKARGVLYLGMGVSGGEEGARRGACLAGLIAFVATAAAAGWLGWGEALAARKGRTAPLAHSWLTPSPPRPPLIPACATRAGPSMMPGGSREAYAHIEAIVSKVAAQVDDGPCVTFIGAGGAGNFVKMVHNGIEYGDMQLISEAYDVLRTLGGLTNEELAAVFTAWNKAELSSFLVEITSIILGKKDDKDPSGKGYLVDKIVDQTGAKGTGKWTVQQAAELLVAAPTIAASLDGRYMSALKPERMAAAAHYENLKIGQPKAVPGIDKAQLIEDVRRCARARARLWGTLRGCSGFFRAHGWRCACWACGASGGEGRGALARPKCSVADDSPLLPASPLQPQPHTHAHTTVQRAVRLQDLLLRAGHERDPRQERGEGVGRRPRLAGAHLEGRLHHPRAGARASHAASVLPCCRSAYCCFFRGV